MVLQRVIFTQALCIFSLIIIMTKMSLAKNVEKLKIKSASLTGVSQTDEGSCYNFTVGNPHRKEFSTPNFPNEYPKNTKCTHRITADPGHTVMLDFRDQFHLEGSSPKCEYDKLEVRDGAYGYSPLLGIFCGNEFPTRQYSTKRHMWLQFTSDDSIEYTGFKAVYDYIPIPNQGKNGFDTGGECAFERSGPSGNIHKVEIDSLWEKYKQDDIMECMWTIITESNRKLYLNFKDYELFRPNDCDLNFIQFSNSSFKQFAKFCGTTADPQTSTTNVTYIRLFTHKTAFHDTNFTLHYTSVREIPKEEKCDPVKEFDCGDQTCVDITLRCDGEFDCKYRYDEDQSICAKALGAGVVLTSEHMIIILVVFFALVIAMCASISISCYNKIKERQVREREYKQRRSKEASVEATIDRNLRGQSTPDRILEKAGPQPPPAGFNLRDADDESSDGCYVPEVDLSVFKHPNGGEIISKKPRAAGLQQQTQQYPFISESFESLESDVIVPPAPPPVPPHMKERRNVSPPPPTYRIVGGKVIANPAKNDPERMLQESRESTLDSKGSSGYGRWPQQDSRPGSTKPAPTGYTRPAERIDTSIRTLDKEPAGPTDVKANFLRGPLEAGAPRSVYSRPPAEIGLPKFGMAKVTPDGPRGPLAGKTPVNEKDAPGGMFRRPYDPTPYPGGYRPGATARNYPIRTEPGPMRNQSGLDSSDKDSSRAHSAASSTLSAPDVIGKR